MKDIKGPVQFAIKGRKAEPKWIQKALKAALDNNIDPDESLRFQCQVAVDARKVFEKIELNDGETFTLHSTSLPQFGKNHRGLAYLTVTGAYSGDGRDYTVRWEGNAIPKEMQRSAVKHDLGLYVKRVVTTLNWEDARITFSTSGKRRGDIEPSTGNIRKRKNGKTGGSRTGRKTRCAGRLCEADLR